MFAIQTTFKYTEKNIGQYLFWGAIIFVIAVTSVIVYRIYNTELNNIAVVDTVELTCDININENDEISMYKLTVTGFLRTSDVHTAGIPPVVLQSFDLITIGTIESIEDIVLFVCINGDTEAVRYDATYALLEKIY